MAEAAGKVVEGVRRGGRVGPEGVRRGGRVREVLLLVWLRSGLLLRGALRRLLGVQARGQRVEGPIVDPCARQYPTILRYPRRLFSPAHPGTSRPEFCTWATGAAA